MNLAAVFVNIVTFVIVGNNNAGKLIWAKQYNFRLKFVDWTIPMYIENVPFDVDVYLSNKLLTLDIKPLRV